MRPSVYRRQFYSRPGTRGLPRPLLGRDGEGRGGARDTVVVGERRIEVYR